MLSKLRKCRYMQYVCVSIATLLQASSSIGSAWVSPVLPQLTSNNTILEAPLTKVEESWFVSGEKLGAIIGCLLAGFITDKLGRKRTLLLAAIPIFLIMITFAFNKIVLVLIILRILLGLSYGISFVVLPMYIGEVSEKDIRGRLSVFRAIINILGTVFVYSLGPFVSLSNFSISCSVFPLVFFILFAFMPETPYHLVKIGKIESAEASLKRLSKRGLSDDVIQVRLQEIQDFVAMDIKSKVYVTDLVTNKFYRKPFLIVLAIRCLLGLSGLPVIASYLIKLIENSNSVVSPEISSVIFGIIRLPPTLITAFLIDKIGRRLLLIISTIGCAITLLVEGVYFYFQETTDVSTFSWVPTTGLSLYLLSVCVGIDVLLTVVIGEIFTANVKSIASACVACVGFALSFVLLQGFKPLSDILGVYTIFWFFSGCCIVGCLFAIFLLPETKGKSFLEIQKALSSSNDLEKNKAQLQPLMN